MGPVGPCDTAMVVSFTGDLTPILAASCTPCHSGGSPEGGLDLTLHSSVAQSGTDGNLVERMRLPMTDVGFMPRNGAPLPECDIVLFESWIAQGALDN